MFSIFSPFSVDPTEFQKENDMPTCPCCGLVAYPVYTDMILHCRECGYDGFGRDNTPAELQGDTIYTDGEQPTQHDSTSRCGCTCICHTDEATPEWPGPCAGCCERGDDCKCGRALAEMFRTMHEFRVINKYPFGNWCIIHHDYCDQPNAQCINRSIHDEELNVARERALSPWVKRNLDGAQYAQPRGSEYEG